MELGKTIIEGYGLNSVETLRGGISFRIFSKIAINGKLLDLKYENPLVNDDVYHFVNKSVRLGDDNNNSIWFRIWSSAFFTLRNSL